MASCLPEASAYERASRHVKDTQAQLLLRILHRHRDTWFGRKHGFALIRGVRDFQSALPLTSYDDYRDAVARIANGEPRVLTSDPVRLFEPTGGSSRGEKLIPYTTELQRSIQRAIRIWICNLFSKRPAVRQGRAYWSISPLAQIGRRTQSGIPIGFDDDAAYLGGLEQRLAAKAMVAPREIAFCPSVAVAQYATLYVLLRAADLSLISVWSPTFLIELFKILWDRRDDLCDDIARGQIYIDCAGDKNVFARARYRPMIHRAQYLRRAFRDARNITECIAAIWPSLALVSCWADGPSLAHANNLRRYLPGIELQPKGLLATEAFVTVPFISLPAPALALRSHFFEFQLVEDAGPDNGLRLHLAHELTSGYRYRVIVTTTGGLYRYQLHDEVEVVGFKSQAPLLRFIGKTDETSDAVGEKLDAAHVQRTLQSAFDALGLTPTYSQLRVNVSATPNYVLQIVEPTLHNNTPLQRRLCDEVERGLSSNPGYRYARSLGQLLPLTVDVLEQHVADDLDACRIKARVASGQRLGDVKPATLSVGGDASPC
jgi:hypothetical protein